jgi:long-chain acyl-CoA synthetase
VLGRARLALDRGLTLGSVAERVAVVYGDRIMVDEEGWTLTFAEAADLVERWSTALAARIAPGDRVVLATPNGHRQLLATLAVSRAGGVAVPVNAQMRPAEVAHVVDDAGADVVVEDVAELEPPGRRSSGPAVAAVAADPDDLAALFYTSGTTGRPKGVRLSHRALIGASRLGALNVLPAPTAVMALPIAHIMGFAAGLGFALAGIPVATLRRFDATAVLDLIEERRAAIFIGVPAMYRLLLEAGAEDRNLRGVHLWLSGADVMPPEVAERFQRLGSAFVVPGVGPVGQAAFVEGYGLAESAGAVAVKAHVPLPGLGRLLTGDAVGLPLPGVRFRVREGELEVRAPGVTSGYWGDAEATADALTEDGWLRTGDRATIGPFGTVRFRGRAKDVIKVGGYSVYSVEVEAVLAAHPAVAEAAVLGVADDRLGEVPVAAVRLVPDADPATDPEVLLAEATADLAPYKRPRQLIVVDDLPRTGTGKVQKSRLRHHFG